MLDHTTGLDDGSYALVKPTAADLFDNAILESRNYAATTTNPCTIVFYYHMFGVCLEFFHILIFFKFKFL